jgi:quercetin dioxygenase-like cupin family protein
MPLALSSPAMSDGPRVIEQADLEVSATAKLFEGHKHGADASFFMTEHPPGEGPGLHRHPYQETFVIQSGTGWFTVDDEEVEAHGGQIVIVPANTWHGFKAIGDEPLVQLSIHPAPRMQQEWLEEDELPGHGAS